MGVVVTCGLFEWFSSMLKPTPTPTSRLNTGPAKHAVIAMFDKPCRHCHKVERSWGGGLDWQAHAPLMGDEKRIN
jgi:hypothetical protein